MDKSMPNADAVFALAIELPAGSARSGFVAAQFGDNAALLGEVESLLRAHDQAGAFLRSSADQREIPLGTAIMNTGALAKYRAAPENQRAPQVEQVTPLRPEPQATH